MFLKNFLGDLITSVVYNNGKKLNSGFLMKVFILPSAKAFEQMFP